jgi:predicted membrane GTPase involved in stress response
MQMTMVSQTGWFYRKNDKKGNVEMKNKKTGEIIKQINGGSWDNYTIIHIKQDGTFFVKQTEQMDACMYVACHRDGDTVYSDNWAAESKEKYGNMALQEMIVAFAKESTKEQTADLLEIVEELVK